MDLRNRLIDLLEHAHTQIILFVNFRLKIEKSRKLTYFQKRPKGALKWSYFDEKLIYKGGSSRLVSMPYTDTHRYAL